MTLLHRSLLVALLLPSTVRAAEVVEASGVRGGFVVHVGCGDGTATADLRVGERYQVHGLDRDPANVARAREQLRAAGIYGDVSVDRLTGNGLPYVDNMVNLLVVEPDAGIARDELLRVLAPNGVAMIRDGDDWTKVVKPRSEQLDEWTHYLHDSTGNPVAHDDVVGPPEHLQWVGSPKWSRHHDRMASISAMVSAGGRLFYIEDTGSRISIQMPAKWQVVARDAFNGVVLWRRNIPLWHNHLWPLKSGPTQLTRRLVAGDGKVFVTLGLGEPVTALDATTGETLTEYAGTKGTEEIVHAGDTLLLLVNEGEWDLADFEAQLNTSDQGRVAKEYKWNEKPRKLVAVDENTGEILWSRESKVAPLTLAADDERAYFHDGAKVVCVGRRSGEDIWASKPVQRRSFLTFNFGPRLVVNGNVLLFAGGDRNMTAVDAATGEEKWTAPHARSGYQSPEDLLVAGGLVWNAPTTSGKDSGEFVGRDPETGEIVKQFPPNVDTYWFHHRCYIAKATDKFLMPSRTGIEFVDPNEQDWDINHWVRGGCLYGVMPCNGLVYAPPHDCACYPEAKLYGINALAPTTPSREVPENIAPRLEKGPAFGNVTGGEVGKGDWPTYRHDHGRSGFNESEVPDDLKTKWTAKLGGRLSAPVVAAGRVYVAKIDEHTIYALNEADGSVAWTFTAGGRIDSPPTILDGRVLFGSMDGSVYQLRASDGELVWRFRAAPVDRRLMAFEQLESVWPVHGTILVRGDEAWFVAGRSNFLDGGLTLFRLNVETGETLSETIIDDRDPDTGGDAQDRLQILQMQVGLNDVLSQDDKFVYLKSQKFDAEGNRLEVGPVSGDFATQGGAQRGEGVHLFAPMGYLDGSWFHRAYWVWGRNFAGGHGGYYQAGKFTPSGRILVADRDNVYGYGRKPQYYKWTSVLEHQLFSASKEQPDVPARGGAGGGAAGLVDVPKSKSLDPTNKELTVSAWVNAEKPAGVVLAHGGPSRGYALIVSAGKPRFLVREGTEEKDLAIAMGPDRIVGKWTHLAGTLAKDGTMKLYVNGELVDTKQAKVLTEDPAQGLQIGGDNGSPVGNYKSPNSLTGLVDEVRIDHVALNKDAIDALYDGGAPVGRPVLVLDFDQGAKDASGKGNDPNVAGVDVDRQGRSGSAVRFTGRGGAGGTAGNRNAGSIVELEWYRDVPLYARAMVLAGDTLFIAGPPDTINEEETFERITNRDATVKAELAEQDALLEGRDGAVLWGVSKSSGDQRTEVRLPALPVWDGMATANGRLYVATEDGLLVRIGEK